MMTKAESLAEMRGGAAALKQWLYAYVSVADREAIGSHFEALQRKIKGLSKDWQSDDLLFASLAKYALTLLIIEAEERGELSP